MPITDTQPAHLATPTTPFGIAAPAINRPPMLERGCASGGNVIRLPVRFPGAGVTGVGISRRHIAGSHKRISEGSLRSCESWLGDLCMLKSLRCGAANPRSRDAQPQHAVGGIPVLEPEKHIEFMSGRRFRRSVLVHHQQATEPRRSLASRRNACESRRGALLDPHAV